MCSGSTTTWKSGTTSGSTRSSCAIRSRTTTRGRLPSSGSRDEGRRTRDDIAPLHEPVLLDEVLSFLQPGRGGTYVDCTLGLGGHTRALLERGAERVIGLDRDTHALRLAEASLSAFRDRLEAAHADYRTLDAVLDARGLETVDGILADLGVSSMQLDAEGRGV
ncbi:MAG TPA: 16S rRNA (cytosine(1402)-N(4))-methyltransferase, partial [Vicinamibacterales bacterium]|nr:16S rRNA (cytosine(1402)-N(4))-methyltransferase [Vicinamibacterales bacterium]